MMQSKWVYPVLISLVGAVIYANSLQNGFTFDDWPLVVQNPLVVHPNFGAIFSSAYWPDRPELGLYRPLTTLSYVINRWVLGDGAWGFHLVNGILHVVNAVLVFVGTRKIFGQTISCLCAFVFLVHPLQTEAVNSIVGRAELLAGFWMLVAWCVYLYDRGWRRWGLVAVAVFLGCLCKEHAAMMVGILAVAEFAGVPHMMQNEQVERVSFRVLWARFFKEGFSGILVCVGAVVLFFIVRYAVVGGVLLPSQPAFVDNPLAHVEKGERLLTAFGIVWTYAVLMVGTGHLSADYSYAAIPIVSSVWTGAVVGGIFIYFILHLFLVSVVRGNTPPIWGVIVSWILLPFLPVSNVLFPIGTVMAERLMYVPMVGYAMLWGLVFWLMWRRFPRLAWGIMVVLLLGWAKQTVQRNPDWKNDYTLFASAVEAVPQSAKAHFNLGNAVRDLGDQEAALSHYHQAVWIYPQYAEVHYNVGVIQQAEEKSKEALRAYQNALSADSTHVGAWINVGVLHAQSGEHLKAAQLFNKALALDPERISVQFNYALSLQRLDRIDEAQEFYMQVLEGKPDHEDAAINLAELYVQQGKMDRAIEVLKDLVTLRETAYQGALNLATLLEKQGRYEEAIDAFLIGANGKEDKNVLALFAGARLYGQLGRYEDAKRVLDLFIERWQGDEAFKVRAQQIRDQLNVD